MSGPVPPVRMPDLDGEVYSPAHEGAVAAENNISKDKASTTSSIAMEKANAVGANLVQQANTLAVDVAARANMMANNAVDQANATMNNTTETARMKIMAHPAVQQTTEQFAADSHDMAHKTYGIQGAVQTHDGAPVGGVRDIGWHRPVIEIPDPLIGGLPNGRLFSLIRRFNKVRRTVSHLIK